MWHDGITPAWAGKREAVAAVGWSSEDHPRVGGEKLVSIIPTSMGTGSPPRGRGKD